MNTAERLDTLAPMPIPTRHAHPGQSGYTRSVPGLVAQADAILAAFPEDDGADWPEPIGPTPVALPTPTDSERDYYHRNAGTLADGSRYVLDTTERTTTRDLMDQPVPTVRKRKLTDGRSYVAEATRYGADPASVTNVDGQWSRLGTYVVTYPDGTSVTVEHTEASARARASAANGRKGGRKATGALSPAAERKRRQRERERAERMSLADRDEQRQQAKIADRLATPWL